MGKINKAVAGGVAAALCGVVVTVMLGWLPESMASAEQFESSLRYLLYTVLTGAAVYAAPKNAE